MNNHQARIAEFMLKCNQVLPNYPSIPDKKTINLRINLITEEFEELIKELNKEKISLPDLAKEIADLSVVLFGTAISFGIDMEPILKIVDFNNLSKVNGKHSFREDGKLLKPLDYKKVDLTLEIEKQSKEKFFDHLVKETNELL